MATPHGILTALIKSLFLLLKLLKIPNRYRVLLLNCMIKNLNSSIIYKDIKFLKIGNESLWLEIFVTKRSNLKTSTNLAQQSY